MKKTYSFRLSDESREQLSALNENATEALRDSVELAYWLSVPDEQLIARYGLLKRELLPSFSPFCTPVLTWLIVPPPSAHNGITYQLSPRAYFERDCDRAEAVEYFGNLLRTELVRQFRAYHPIPLSSPSPTH